MRIGLITLPLHTNYGGLLQAYALKTHLESMGHEVTVIDRKVKMPMPAWWKAPLVYAKRCLVRIIKGKSAPEIFRERRYRAELPLRSVNTARFIGAHISPRIVKSYKNIKEGEYDAFVVGSDQVWRPLYFGKINDAFLAFARDWDVIRVAYAASFGTDKLEYEFIQLEECAALLEKFDGVSVREDTAVLMCNEWFDCDGVIQTIDPVMLLDKEQYLTLIGESTHSCKGKLVSYILDKSPHKQAMIDFFARVSSMEVSDVSAPADDRKSPVDERIVPPVEDWVCAFADAGFVVTDSFHGCVLSILFHKPFVVVGNPQRGMSRILSLLNMFGLDSRLVQGLDPEDDGEYFLSDPDWTEVDRILDEQRIVSKEFLLSSLNRQ